MSDKEKSALASYRFTAMVMRLMNKAAKNAQLENRSYGLPNIYSRNKKLYYAMPDGRVLTQEQYDQETETKS